jgi:NhaP-type Na+/H+ and K+/H+ antiporter
VQEVDWPAGSRMVEVLRGGRVVEPKALQRGDLVAVVAPTEQVGALEELFGPAAAAGELTLDASATLGDLCDFYGAELPAGASTSTALAEYAERVLRGRAASGDLIVLGGLKLRVRESSAGRIRSLSLQLARTTP